MADEKPTYEELEHINFHNERMKEERECSDAKYADKKEFTLVQRIVFSTVAIILVTVLGSFIALVVK